jgi:3-hydroxyacyl-[acyl-carrier-protein] dehydratase
MRFHLIDRIDAVDVGKSLRAIKHVSLAEEYLADHFPSFPVMPGVLQLQALVEAGSWLMRITQRYARSIWVLREVRGVKYGTFVAPGHALQVYVELTKDGGSTVTLKGRGEVDGQQSIAATVTLAGYNLRDRNPAWSDRDERLVRQLQSHYEWLTANGDRLAAVSGPLLPG